MDKTSKGKKPKLIQAPKKFIPVIEIALARNKARDAVSAGNIFRCGT
jgi:hypothetical protein